VFALVGVSFSEFAYLPASNTRGGILIAARKSDVSISNIHLGCYSLTVRVYRPSLNDQDCPWWLSYVYRPQHDHDKAIFLEELEAIRDANQGPWAICKDFNLILSEADKSN
jgi:hypothetical protein